MEINLNSPKIIFYVLSTLRGWYVGGDMVRIVIIYNYDGTIKTQFVFVPCVTLLSVRDDVIHAGVIMISKYVNPRVRFYSYSSPKYNIKDHIDKNL